MIADRIGFSDDLFRPLGKDVDRVFGSAADWVGDGKSLSDRLWLAGKMDRRAIDGILRHGLATGADPLKVARDLEDYLLPAGRPVRDTVPTAWWDFSVESGPLKSRVVKRAYYRAGQYTASGLHVSGEVSRHANVAVHEFGHRMEHIDGQIRDLETLFYQRRTTGERLAHMGPGYAKDELTRRDQFRHPYIGKDYGGQHYEILSMGMQDLFGEQEFIWDDPDMADFILGILGTI